MKIRMTWLFLRGYERVSCIKVLGFLLNIGLGLVRILLLTSCVTIA